MGTPNKQTLTYSKSGKDQTCNITNFRRVTYHEHLGDVASAENLVDRGKFMRLMRGEVWGEGAFLSTSSS